MSSSQHVGRSRDCSESASQNFKFKGDATDRKAMASGIQLVPGWGPGALFSLCPGCRRTDTDLRGSNLHPSAGNKLNGEWHNLSAGADRAMRRGAGRRVQAANEMLCGAMRFSQPLNMRAVFVPGARASVPSTDRVGGQCIESGLGFGSGVGTQRAGRVRPAASAFLKPGSSTNHPDHKSFAASELEQSERPTPTSSEAQHDRKSDFHDPRPSSSRRAGDASVRFSQRGRGRAKSAVEAPPQNRVWRRGGVPTPPAQSLVDTPLEQKPLSRTSVVVSNLPPETAQAEIESLFDTFGPLESVDISNARKGKLSAVVRFLEPWANESAAKAVQNGNGLIWRNHWLRVCFEGAKGGANEGMGAEVASNDGRDLGTDRVSYSGRVSNSGGFSNTNAVWRRSEFANRNGVSGGSKMSDRKEAPDQPGTPKRFWASDGASDALGALEGGLRTRLREAGMQRPPDVRKVEHLFSQLLEVRVQMTRL